MLLRRSITEKATQFTQVAFATAISAVSFGLPPPAAAASQAMPARRAMKVATPQTPRARFPADLIQLMRRYGVCVCGSVMCLSVVDSGRVELKLASDWPVKTATKLKSSQGAGIATFGPKGCLPALKGLAAEVRLDLSQAVAEVAAEVVSRNLPAPQRPPVHAQPSG